MAATRLAPLRGRKVLVFSDSRQMAARLAPNLQTYSARDALRPLVVFGYGILSRPAELANLLSLEDLYLGVLIAAKQMGVRLRPELKVGESFQDEYVVEEKIRAGALENPAELLQLLVGIRGSAPPKSLLWAITKTLTDRYYGLESLALASLVERRDHSPRIADLPDIPRYAQSAGEKIALARAWLRCWLRPCGIWLSRMSPEWWLE